jgi:acyl-CoA thioesterase-1
LSPAEVSDVLAADAAPAVAARQSAKRPDPALSPIEDVPGLPRVLLIGDSISIGYTIPTRELLVGKANVHRIPVNGGPTTRGLEHIEEWVGTSKWDVIHFNFGLHDIKHVDDAGTSVDAAAGHRQVELDTYRDNLRAMVKRLQRTGARLIWCSTTPVPKGAKGRVPGDEAAYNAAAAGVMQEAGVEINDLHAFAAPQMAEIGKPADVLWAMEQALECRDLGAVLGEIWGEAPVAGFTATKRLALRAEAHGVPCWLIRRAARPDLSAARERWRVASAPALPHPDDDIAPGLPVWQAELFRARGRQPGRWEMSWDAASRRRMMVERNATDAAQVMTGTGPPT